MNPAEALKHVIMPTLEWMGKDRIQLASPHAGRLILAAAIQESDLMHRHQIGGPAHGFGQEEPIGAAEALRIDNSILRTRFLDRIGLPQDAVELHRALEWSEIGMVISARLKLWPISAPLPASAFDEAVAWHQYKTAWKPGKPHRHRWQHSWSTACQAMTDVGLP